MGTQHPGPNESPRAQTPDNAQSTFQVFQRGVEDLPTLPPRPDGPGIVARGLTVDEPDADLSGRIGKYQLCRPIGYGGMGEVYEAIQSDPHRVVALKRMHRGLDSDEAMERFRREAHVLALLKHPGIAQIYDADTHPVSVRRAGSESGSVRRIPYYVMEYIEGSRSLTDFAKDKSLDQLQRLELFLKVCDAVHWAHEQGVVHRDLKPSNILVDATDARHPQPKVIDFGIARIEDLKLPSESGVAPTVTGQLLGTLQYMSPEACRADPTASPVDRRHDIYALGIILYELLWERMPYQLSGMSVPAALNVVQNEPALHPRTFGSVPAPDLWTVVSKAIHKDAERRYATAADFADDLRRFMTGEPIMARPDSAWYLWSRRTRNLASRHRVLSALVIAALVTFGVTPLVLAPLAFSWTGLNEAFERIAFSAWGSFNSASPLDNVRIIAIRDKGRLAQAASRLGISGVDPQSNPKSLRLLHAEFMRRLAGASTRPRAVAWDLDFRGDEFSAELCAGAEALRARGVETIIVDDWRYRPESLTGACFIGGGATATVGDRAPWRIDLGIQAPDGEGVPSLALLAAAHARLQGVMPVGNPGGALGAAFSIDIDDDKQQIVLRSIQRDDAGRASPIEGASEWRIPVLDVAPAPLDEWEDLGVEKEDIIAQYSIDLPGRRALDASTFDYEEVLAWSDDGLKTHLGDAVIIIGDFTNTEDVHPSPSSGIVEGVYAQATAIDHLLLGRHVWSFGTVGNLAVEVACALLGASVGFLLARRRQLLISALVMMCIAITMVGIGMLPLAHLLINPWISCLQVLVAALVAALLVPAGPQMRMNRVHSGNLFQTSASSLRGSAS